MGCQQLKGKNAIVTGGGAGIGRDIALSFAREGANVAIIDINEDNGKKVVEELIQLGVRSVFFQEDLSLKKTYHQLISDIEAELGETDILVNNAGISFTTKIPDIDPDLWDLIMNTNARSMFFMSQAVFLGMMERKRGRIINISSISGDRPALFSDAVYCASKAAVLMITKTFAKAAKETEITVNSVSPGYIETEMSIKIGTKVTSNDVPMGRMGYSSEIADAVVYLASDKASYISGHNLKVNGGAYMG